MTDVVLDLETFGTAPDSAVVSIGAVNVANDNWFYGVIANPSGAVDAGAVRWWLNQAPEVREAVKVGQDEQEVLGAFMRWLTDEARGQGTPEFPRTIRLWGSEDFDTVILGNAYRRNGAEPPWHYQEPRGLRTVLDLTGVDDDAIPWEGTEHIAIDCARHAATALQQALAILTERTTVNTQPIQGSVSGEGEGSVTE